VAKETTPPASITGLNNLTTEQSRIGGEWADPADADFAEVMIYLDGAFKTNVSKGVKHYTATGLTPDTNYTIGTHTVDDKGNINQTWVNDTTKTLPFSGLQRINVTPTAWTMKISEFVNFNATGYGHNDDPIDPANLTFAWYTTPSGIGTLNATIGSVVNFTARHAGRTEIYAVNGSVTDSVWLTVNALPETEDVTNGTGNATSGNSTATPTPSGSSGGDGTCPPGWFGTPAPSVTATKAPAASTTATVAPPGERVTPSPTQKTAAAKATTPAAEGATTTTPSEGAPGFTAVSMIAGMLAVAYVVMRRRE